MKIIITTMNDLPEYCHDCPCCHNGYCKADKEQREAQPYRPYWCPLREEKDEKIAISEDQARQHSIKVPCNMCGKIVEHYSFDHH